MANDKNAITPKLIILRGNSGSGKTTVSKICRKNLGERDMRRWWKEKDFIRIIPEKIITERFSVSETVDMIYNSVL